ncbi:type II secretion system minor pseudopilin GspJ [Acinetobacter sp. ULE_I010]|uniref:type II secretion system minor pseudopilin GspJ n=1 Tax=Acinetobacter sp. ULE_I010 TaxID=3373065 RepID=UPI003AF8A565
MKMMIKNNKKAQNFIQKSGFTLVELLVAIAIFAVLSALGWKIFDYLIKVKDRNAMHEENLGQLQEAYQQIQRDTLQIIPVSANNGGEIEPPLRLDNQKLTFSKAGVTDPLKQGVSPYERVEYHYEQQEKKLYRLKYSNLNRVRSEQPLSSVLLANVDQFQVSVLNPNELDRWANDQETTENLLPRGLKIKVTIHDIEYEWMFSLLNTNYEIKKS